MIEGRGRLPTLSLLGMALARTVLDLFPLPTSSRDRSNLAEI